VFAHWEGDWSIRGNYDINTKPTQTAITGMQQWLAARQLGVTQARAVLNQTGAYVYHAAEINLVQQSIDTNFPNMVLSVLPYVALDLVSYSAYDTQSAGEGFGNALDYVIAHLNRTAASPPIPLYIGEFGLPQEIVAQDQLTYMVECVVNTALARGCPYILFWEVYCNECSASGCNCEIQPVTDPTQLHGYWLVTPNGTKAWPYTYFNGLFLSPPP